MVFEMAYVLVNNRSERECPFLRFKLTERPADRGDVSIASLAPSLSIVFLCHPSATSR